MAKTTNRLTEFEKARIIAGYEAETPVSMIAKVLGVKLTTATSFYSRFMKNFGLPAKLKVSKSKITAAIGLAIKNAVRDSPKAGLARIKGLIIKSLPNEPWYPSKTTRGKYLKENNKVKKKHRLKPFIEKN